MGVSRNPVGFVPELQDRSSPLNSLARGTCNLELSGGSTEFPENTGRVTSHDIINTKRTHANATLISDQESKTDRQLGGEQAITPIAPIAPICHRQPLNTLLDGSTGEPVQCTFYLTVKARAAPKHHYSQAMLNLKFRVSYPRHQTHTSSIPPPSDHHDFFHSSSAFYQCSCRFSLLLCAFIIYSFSSQKLHQLSVLR